MCQASSKHMSSDQHKIDRQHQADGKCLACKDAFSWRTSHMSAVSSDPNFLMFDLLNTKMDPQCLVCSYPKGRKFKQNKKMSCFTNKSDSTKAWKGHFWRSFRTPVGNFDADKGLESGLSVPIFQYFRSRNSPMGHYCNVFHLSLFWFLWYQTSPILGC